MNNKIITNDSNNVLIGSISYIEPIGSLFGEIHSKSDTCHSQGDFKLRTVNDGWRELIAGFDADLMFTLSFIRSYSDKTSIDSLNHFMKRVHRALFGPRWDKKGRFMDALCVAERHTSAGKKMGSLHFHILMKIDKLNLCLDDARLRLKHAALQLSDEWGRKMCSDSLVSADVAYDMGGLSHYLMKQSWSGKMRSGAGILVSNKGTFDGVSFELLSLRGQALYS